MEEKLKRIDMYFRRNLRQAFSIAGFIPAMICVPVFFLVGIFLGIREAIFSVYLILSSVCLILITQQTWTGFIIIMTDDSGF